MMQDGGAWRAIIEEMQTAERRLPRGEMWAVDTMHWLADFLVDRRVSLTREQRAMLIAIGGMIAREANRETMAALEADLVLRRVGLI